MRKKEVSWIDIAKLDALGATLPGDEEFGISRGVDPSQVVCALNEVGVHQYNYARLDFTV